MPIPSEIQALVEQINNELDQIEQNTTEALTIARVILDRFPENNILIQMFAF